jgi:hypothetical protein
LPREQRRSGLRRVYPPACPRALLVRSRCRSLFRSLPALVPAQEPVLWHRAQQLEQACGRAPARVQPSTRRGQLVLMSVLVVVVVLKRAPVFWQRAPEPLQVVVSLPELARPQQLLARARRQLRADVLRLAPARALALRLRQALQSHADGGLRRQAQARQTGRASRAPSAHELAQPDRRSEHSHDCAPGYPSDVEG